MRWDRLLDGYLDQYKARGLSELTVERVTQQLTDWGQWLMRRQPRPALESVDADLLTRYIETRSSFRAKSTVYATLSTMRGMETTLYERAMDDQSAALDARSQGAQSRWRFRQSA